MANRKFAHIKHASGLTTNAKLHEADKAKHSCRFAAFINGRLVPIDNKPRLVSVTVKRDPKRLEQEYFDLDFRDLTSGKY